MQLFASLIIAGTLCVYSAEQLPRLILSGSSTNGNRKFLEVTTKREYVYQLSIF